MTIVSNIPGRLRVRDQRLTGADKAKQVHDGLLALDGVTEVTVGLRTGSLLIVHSAAPSCVQGIMDLLTGMFGPEEENGYTAGGYPFRPSGLVKLPGNELNFGMLAALLASMAGITIGPKKLHYAAGVLFLALSAIHLFERRRAMFSMGGES